MITNQVSSNQNEVSNHVFISHLFVEETIQSLEPTYPESIRLTGRSDQKPLVVSNLEIASTLCPAPAPRASRKLFLDRSCSIDELKWRMILITILETLVWNASLHLWENNIMENKMACIFGSRKR